MQTMPSIIKTMVLISMISMCWWRNHLLMMLLSLEMLLLSSFLLMCLYSPSTMSFTLMIFLATMVSASSFGLSMLIAIARSHKSALSAPILSLVYNTYSPPLIL